MLDDKNNTIRYYTVSDVAGGDELCINYGPHLWFPDSGDHISNGDRGVDAAGDGRNTPGGDDSDDDDPEANENKWLYKWGVDEVLKLMFCTVGAMTFNRPS